MAKLSAHSTISGFSAVPLRKTSPRALWLTCACAFLVVAPVTGQTIIGKVLDDSNGAPIRVADVQLLDTEGTARARAVSDTAGLFRLVAPVPGKYTLRAALIGY